MTKSAIAILTLSLMLVATLAGLASSLISSSREYGALVQQVSTATDQIKELKADVKMLTIDFNGTRAEIMRLVGRDEVREP